MSASRTAALPIVQTDVVPIGSTAPVAETLPAAIDRIVAEVQPERVILFGSYAYGTPTPDSDVDLLVLLDSILSVDERYLLVSEALRPRPFPLDLIVLTPSELADRLDRGYRFVTDILARGVVLYERPE